MADKVRPTLRGPDLWDSIFFPIAAGIRKYGTVAGVAVAAALATPANAERLSVASSFPAAQEASDRLDALRVRVAEEEKDPTPDWKVSARLDCWDIGKWLSVPPGVLGAMKMARGVRKPILLTISANTTNYDIRANTVAHPDYVASVPLTVILTINSAVYVGGTATTTGTGWVTGTVLFIVNNGFLVGQGGFGGGGGSCDFAVSYPGQNAGSPLGGGANALSLQWSVTIDNTNGYVFGGSGGFGGGGSAVSPSGSLRAGGGGGASGRGYPAQTTVGPGGGGPNPGGDGGVNDQNGIAFGGTGASDGGGIAVGGDGGGAFPTAQAWAATGGSGFNGSYGALGGPGGAPGKAVNLNGFTVTWTGGYNSTQVKGAVS